MTITSKKFRRKIMTKKFLELEAKMSPEGGELEVVARFPDGDVRISNFSQI
jgi:hypothetical protein